MTPHEKGPILRVHQRLDTSKQVPRLKLSAMPSGDMMPDVSENLKEANFEEISLSDK